ncbi:hypothetical protein VTJ83DRAFT_2996 [Remersonia thermophila]|uniref:Uncharacterized protein n=1 Tax=Remersonia thermophila TaxID=72144 RepID=A0ABR4DCV8_9PEZI
MCRPLSEVSDEALAAQLGPALPPGASIDRQTLKLLPSTRQQRLFELRLSTGQTLHLALPAVSFLRPQRSEQDLLESEASTVRWIRDTLTKQRAPTPPREDQEPGSPSPPSPDAPITAESLPALLPTLLHYIPAATCQLSPSAVYAPVRGTPLSLLPTPPTPAARETIDRQVGQLFRSLATLTSPTGRFGPLATIIGAPTATPSRRASPEGRISASAAPGTQPTAQRPPPPPPPPPRLPRVLVEGGLSATGGAASWAVAFHSMLEGVLRDGEDMAVVMSYATIRRHVRRLGYMLDEITTPKLVIVDGAEDGNVLIDDTREESQGGSGNKEAVEEMSAEVKNGNGNGIHGKQKEKEEEEEEEEEEAEEEEKKEKEKGVDKDAATESLQKQQQPEPPRVAGLRDWSRAVFGDPLLATVFSDPHLPPPSAAFIAGLSGAKASDPSGTNAANLPYPLPEGGTIESPSTAYVRILLYQVYHAVARIVREFYRPRWSQIGQPPRQQEGRWAGGVGGSGGGGGGGRVSGPELEARRKLNAVLDRLAEVPDDVGAVIGIVGGSGATGKRGVRQRPEGEMSPAKRIRGDEE